MPISSYNGSNHNSSNHNDSNNSNNRGLLGSVLDIFRGSPEKEPTREEHSNNWEKAISLENELREHLGNLADIHMRISMAYRPEVSDFEREKLKKKALELHKDTSGIVERIKKFDSQIVEKLHSIFRKEELIQTDA